MVIYAAKFKDEVVYIGQTVQRPCVRFGTHRSRARKGGNLLFYKAIRKYGESNIKFEILEHASSQDELDFLERYYIKHFSPKYNILSGGKNGYSPWNKGKKELRAHVKANISKSAKTRVRTKRGKYGPEHLAKVSVGVLRSRERSFMCLNNGKVYKNPSVCAKELGITAGGISLVLMPSTRNKSHKGYRFIYL